MWKGSLDFGGADRLFRNEVGLGKGVRLGKGRSMYRRISLCSLDEDPSTVDTPFVRDRPAVYW
jgi:hypothetical protein